MGFASSDRVAPVRRIVMSERSTTPAVAPPPRVIDNPVDDVLGQGGGRGEVAGCPTGLGDGLPAEPPGSDGLPLPEYPEPGEGKLGVEPLEGRQESGREDTDLF